MADRMTGARSPGLAEILKAEYGPTYRQVERWVDLGLLRPEVKTNEGRPTWTWPPGEQTVAIRMGRLVAAGLRPEAAVKIARDPNGGPVILGPGVVVSLFHPQAALGDALNREAVA